MNIKIEDNKSKEFQKDYLVIAKNSIGINFTNRDQCKYSAYLSYFSYTIGKILLKVGFSIMDSKKIRKNNANLKVQSNSQNNENIFNKEKKISKWNWDGIIIQQDLGHIYGSW
jgi:hypothetical protein